MSEPVTIYRDKYGVPHSYGETLKAAAYGSGYAQAVDHLELMLKSYLWGAGEVASVDGPGAIDGDREAHHHEIPEVARQGYATLAQEVRDLCEGFAAGVNLFMKDNPDKTPDWAKPVEGVHLVMLAKRYTLYCDMTIPGPILKEFQAGELTLDAERDTKTTGLIQQEDKLNSNMWAIMPQKSAEGVAMFSGDPHTPWSWPFSFYEAHVSAPGLNVAGAMPYGMPLPSVGVTDNVAWSITANDAMSGSFFLEEVHPDDPDLYRYDDEWRPVVKKTRIIKVRQGGKLVDHELELLYTHRGPAYRNEKGQLASIAAPGRCLVNFLGQALAKARASSVHEFRDALSMQQETSLNTMCADRHGNVYYVNLGRFARRSDGFDWQNAVPGWTSKSEWGDIHPFKDLAQIENPGCGFMQNCNVRAWTTVPGPDFGHDDFPKSFYMPGDIGIRPRGDRVTAILGREKPFTIEEMKKLVFDDYVGQAENVKPVIASAVKHLLDEHDGSFNEELVRGMNERMQAWDNWAHGDSIGATAFHAWLRFFDAAYPNALADADWAPDADQQRAVVEALQQAGELLQRVHGTLDVPYGRVHLHGRGGERMPIGGGFRTLRCATVIPDNSDDGIGLCNFGQGYVLVAAFTDPVQAWTCLPYGVSEAPESPHYHDQAKLYANNELKRLHLRRQDVEAEAISKQELICG